MFDIQLVGPGNKTKTLIVNEQTTIDFLKRKSGVDENVELIYNGQIMEDGTRLIDYGIKNEVYIFVIKINTKTLLEDRQNQQNLLLDNFMSILNQFNITGGTINNLAQPIQRNSFQNELDILESMGFSNRVQNQALLTLYNGNVEIVKYFIEQCGVDLFRASSVSFFFFFYN